MEPVTRQIQIGWMIRPIQVRENVGNPFGLVSAHLAGISFLE